MQAQYLSTRLSAYNLNAAFLKTLSETGSYLWGSTIIRAMLVSATWEPNDIDILVNNEDASAVEAALGDCGYTDKLSVSPYHPIITGDIEREPSKLFAAAVPKIWYFQQWIDLPGTGRARRVVKLWIGDAMPAFNAVDISCCRVAATVGANGTLKFHGRVDGTFRVLYGDPDDGDIYNRITKYKRRLGIE